MIETTTELLIIGSGFVGQTIANSLAPHCRSLTLVDMSPTSISFSHEVQDLFSSVQLSKTASPEGGVGVWGKALTFPSVEQFFGDVRFETWNKAGAGLQYGLANQSFGIRPGCFAFNRRSRRKVSRDWPDLDKYFDVEVHTYAATSELKHGWNLEIKDIRCPKISGNVCAITRLGANWRVELETQNGTLYIVAENLVFASGAIANAALASLASGMSLFPVGNHLSASVGKLHLLWRRIYSQFPNTWRPREKGFVTLSPLPPSSSRPRVGLRFQVASEELFTHHVRQGALVYLQRIKRHIMYKLGAFSTYSVRVMLEHGGDISNKLWVNQLATRKGFSCWVNSGVSIAEREEVIRALSSLELYTDGLPCKLELIDHNEIVWSDAAHYYGTIPMRESLSGELVVDSEYAICGFHGLYSVGASAFPRGSHAHPTYLAVCVAHDFVSKFKASRSRN